MFFLLVICAATGSMSGSLEQNRGQAPRFWGHGLEITLAKRVDIGNGRLGIMGLSHSVVNLFIFRLTIGPELIIIQLRRYVVWKGFTG